MVSIKVYQIFWKASSRFLDQTEPIHQYHVLFPIPLLEVDLLLVGRLLLTLPGLGGRLAEPGRPSPDPDLPLDDPGRLVVEIWEPDRLSPRSPDLDMFSHMHVKFDHTQPNEQKYR